MIRSLPSSQNFMLKDIKSGETRQWGRSMKQIQKPECFSCSTVKNLIFCGGKESWEKQTPEGQDLINISLLGLHYVFRRGEDTTGRLAGTELGSSNFSRYFSFLGLPIADLYLQQQHHLTCSGLGSIYQYYLTAENGSKPKPVSIRGS